MAEPVMNRNSMMRVFISPLFDDEWVATPPALNDFVVFDLSRKVMQSTTVRTPNKCKFFLVYLNLDKVSRDFHFSSIPLFQVTWLLPLAGQICCTPR